MTEFRPSATELRRRARIYLPTEIALVSVGVGRIFATVQSTSGRWAALLLGLLVIGGTVGIAMAFVRRTHLIVAADQVNYVGMFRTLNIRRDQLLRVVRWTDTSYGNTPSDRATVVVAGRDRPPFVLDGALWGSRVLDDFAAALDVPVESFPSAKLVAAADPTALAWRDKHPILIVFLIVGSVLVIALAIAAVG